MGRGANGPAPKREPLRAAAFAEDRSDALICEAKPGARSPRSGRGNECGRDGFALSAGRSRPMHQTG